MAGKMVSDKITIEMSFIYIGGFIGESQRNLHMSGKKGMTDFPNQPWALPACPRGKRSGWPSTRMPARMVIGRSWKSKPKTDITMFPCIRLGKFLLDHLHHKAIQGSFAGHCVMLHGCLWDSVCVLLSLFKLADLMLTSGGYWSIIGNIRNMIWEIRLYMLTIT